MWWHQTSGDGDWPQVPTCARYDGVVIVVVVEIFIHGAVKATVTNAPQSQLNKCVFSSFLNMPTVVSDWRSEAGRLFQSLGPATWKARSPKPVWVCSLVAVWSSSTGMTGNLVMQLYHSVCVCGGRYNSVHQRLQVRLPVLLTKFVEPAQMDSAQFFQRWKVLSQWVTVLR